MVILIKARAGCLTLANSCVYLYSRLSSLYHLWYGITTLFIRDNFNNDIKILNDKNRFRYHHPTQYISHILNINK